MESKPTTIRGQCLAEALALTEGDRNRAYGAPHPNLTCFAGMVEAYLKQRFQTIASDPFGYDHLNSVDGSVLMILAKISRVAVNQFHMDNATDATAYGAIMKECAELNKGERDEYITFMESRANQLRNALKQAEHDQIDTWEMEEYLLGEIQEVLRRE